jgi:hypothetical protein
MTQRKVKEDPDLNVLDLLRMKFLDCGDLHVSKTSLGVRRSGNRYLIYLPANRNYLWEMLHSSKVKVRIFVELPEGEPYEDRNWTAPRSIS